MKYLNKTFTVGGHSEAYSDGWERIFGTREVETPEMVTCGCIEEPHYRRPGCVNPMPATTGQEVILCQCGRFFMPPKQCNCKPR